MFMLLKQFYVTWRPLGNKWLTPPPQLLNCGTLVFLLWFVFLQGLPQTSSLEISPNDQEVILSLYSDFSVICSGQNEIYWKKDSKPILDTGLERRDNTFINILTLRNVTGYDTGEYSCLYKQSAEEKAIYIFVPGIGDCSALLLLSLWVGVHAWRSGRVEYIGGCWRKVICGVVWACECPKVLTLWHMQETNNPNSCGQCASSPIPLFFTMSSFHKTLPSPEMAHLKEI